MGTLTSEEVAAVESAADAYVAAMKAGDWARDAQSFNGGRRTHPAARGAPPGARRNRSLARGIEELVSYELTRDAVDGGDGFAYVRGRYAITLRPSGAPAPISDEGDFLEVWRKEPDAPWRVAEAIWNTRTPLGG